MTTADEPRRYYDVRPDRIIVLLRTDWPRCARDDGLRRCGASAVAGKSVHVRGEPRWVWRCGPCRDADPAGTYLPLEREERSDG